MFKLFKNLRIFIAITYPGKFPDPNTVNNRGKSTCRQLKPIEENVKQSNVFS